MKHGLADDAVLISRDCRGGPLREIHTCRAETGLGHVTIMISAVFCRLTAWALDSQITNPGETCDMAAADRPCFSDNN